MAAAGRFTTLGLTVVVVGLFPFVRLLGLGGFVGVTLAAGGRESGGLLNLRSGF